MRLITQRSQVQILSPLPTSVQVRGPFALRSGRAFGVDVRISHAPDAAERCAVPVHGGQRGPGSWLTVLGRAPGWWATVAPAPG